MRAAVLPAFGADFEIEERPDPTPGVGEVLVDVVACGAGLTLEHVRAGRMGGAPPFIMGHEFAGRVRGLGAGVSGWSPGQAVTGTFYLTCGQCDMCAAGRETLCRNFRGWIGAAIDGAFAEKIVVPARNLVAIPQGVDLAVAGVVADAVATPYHVAKDRLKITAGDRVAVLGAGGGMGVHMLQVVRAFGGVAIGVERDPAKLAALEAGGYADRLVDSSRPDWAADLALRAGGDIAGFVDTVGTRETLAAGASVLGPRGGLVVLGYVAGEELTLSPADLLFKEASVMGTRYCNRAEIAASLELVFQQRVRPVIGARYPLERLNEAFAAIRANAVFGRIVIDIAPI